MEARHVTRDKAASEFLLTQSDESASCIPLCRHGFIAGWDARQKEVDELTKERDELKHYRTRLEMYEGIARDCARERDELRAELKDWQDANIQLVNQVNELRANLEAKECLKFNK